MFPMIKRIDVVIEAFDRCLCMGMRRWYVFLEDINVG